MNNDTSNAWSEVLANRAKRQQLGQPRRIVLGESVGLNGVDTSSVQTLSQAECNALAASGVHFLISKCGNGNDGTDPDYTNTIAWAQNAGLKTMCYQFIYPLQTDPAHPGRDPISQAQLHFNASKGQVAAIDCEWPAPQNWQQWNVSAAFIRQWILSYLQEYERLSGTKPIIYSYPSWVEAVGFGSEFAAYRYWAASYEPTPTIPAPFQSYVLWQTTGGGGKLPNGQPVDTDVCPVPALVWGAETVPSPIDLPAPTPAPQPDPVPEPLPPSTPADPTTSIWSSIGNTITQLFRKS